MPMDQHGATLALGEKLHGHSEVTSVRFPIGICNGCGGRVVNVETGEGHGSHEWRQEAAATPALDVGRLTKAHEMAVAEFGEEPPALDDFCREVARAYAALTPEGGSDG